MLLTQAEQEQVAAAITEVEQRTDAELVTVLAARADDYRYLPVLWAAFVALLLPALLLWQAWLTPFDMLLAQWLVFLCLAVLLRWQPLMMRLLPKRVKHWRAANLARRQFLENNLHHTAAESGILIFVSEAERYVEIIADRGINQHVNPAQWQQLVDDFTARVREGDTLAGFLHCIRACGELLAEHVPATHERNELPNHLVIL